MTIRHGHSALTEPHRAGIARHPATQCGAQRLEQLIDHFGYASSPSPSKESARPSETGQGIPGLTDQGAGLSRAGAPIITFTDPGRLHLLPQWVGIGIERSAPGQRVGARSRAASLAAWVSNRVLEMIPPKSRISARSGKGREITVERVASHWIAQDQTRRAVTGQNRSLDRAWHIGIAGDPHRILAERRRSGELRVSADCRRRQRSDGPAAHPPVRRSGCW